MKTALILLIREIKEKLLSKLFLILLIIPIIIFIFLSVALEETKSSKITCYLDDPLNLIDISEINFSEHSSKKFVFIPFINNSDLHQSERIKIHISDIISIEYNNISKTTIELLKSEIENYLLRKNTDYSVPNIIIEENSKILSEKKLNNSIFLLLMFTFSIVAGSQSLLRSFSEEKSSAVLELLLSSVDIKSLFISKVLSLIIISLIQILLFFLFQFFILNINLIFIQNLNALVILLHFILGLLTYGFLLTGMGILIGNDYSLQQISSLLGIVLILPIILFVPIIKSPESILSIALSYIPLISIPINIVKISLFENLTFRAILPLIANYIYFILLVRFTNKYFTYDNIVNPPTLKQILK